MIAPACWRRGIASEAGQRIIRNLASIKLAEKLGFSRMGLKRDADYFKGSTSHGYRSELSRSHDR